MGSDSAHFSVLVPRNLIVPLMCLTTLYQLHTFVTLNVVMVVNTDFETIRK